MYPDIVTWNDVVDLTMDDTLPAEPRQVGDLYIPDINDPQYKYGYRYALIMHHDQPFRSVRRFYNQYQRKHGLPEIPRKVDTTTKRYMRRMEGRTRERMYPRKQELGENVYATKSSETYSFQKDW